MRSNHVNVLINLARVRVNGEAIRTRTGVPLIAVIKSDAYGLGAPQVAAALDGVADEFAYFTLAEAREVGQPGIVLGPPGEEHPEEFRLLRLRPAVASINEAERFRGWPVAINFDTGMQRFGCDEATLETLLERCIVSEVFTHAGSVEAARHLRERVTRRGIRIHAASTSLLNDPTTWLDAVRPGFALYEGAVRVTTRLHSVRETSGAIGYTGFNAPRVGVILTGYAQQFRPGPVVINGRRQRVLEVGMNTSFVSVSAADHAGDEVVLLGDELRESEVAAAIGVRPHEALCRYTALGRRSYTSVYSNPREFAKPASPNG